MFGFIHWTDDHADYWNSSQSYSGTVYNPVPQAGVTEKDVRTICQVYSPNDCIIVFVCQCGDTVN